MELKDQRAAVGESVKFICKFAGTPRPGRYCHPPPPNEFMKPNEVEKGDPKTISNRAKL